MTLRAAYIDTSALLAVLFGEPSAAAIRRRLRTIDGIYSSSLLEAEVLSSLARERIPVELARDALGAIRWVLPDRPLSSELNAALAAGRLRGADLWHVACALFLADGRKSLAFLTLDEAQAGIAQRLGLETM